MTKLTDGKRTVGIMMNTWAGTQYTEDWSSDFFQVGGLKYNEGLEAYIVDDVEYCIDQAMDWKDSEGDFSEDEPNENNNVLVIFETPDDVDEF